jgi:hypothetical protein
MVGLAHFGIVAAVFLGVRTLLVAVIALWSLKADQAGRAHALALLQALKFALPVRDRSP